MIMHVRVCAQKIEGKEMSSEEMRRHVCDSRLCDVEVMSFGGRISDVR